MPLAASFDPLLTYLFKGIFVKGITLVLSLMALIQFSFADEVESHLIEGIKYSDDKTESVTSKAIIPNNSSFDRGFNDLVPFVIGAPYQDNAGSCLFMSHTGALEVLMSKKRRQKTNLSERYFMNLQKASIGENAIENWRTDTIERINATGITYKNRDFPFTKGWYKTVNGKRVKAREEDQGAFYGTRYNWIVELTSLNSLPKIKIPKLKRDVIFADPAKNQWNVGTAPKDITSKVKDALKKNKAPVVVIYNHVGFWHATLVVGFNDHASTESCPFVSKYDEKMNKRADEIVEEASQVNEESTKAKLLRKAKNFRRRGASVQKSYLKDGGCKPRGVFYVRDSIYPNKEQPLYDYDPLTRGEEQHLNAPVILREYAWLEQLSNHAIQIRFE